MKINHRITTLLPIETETQTGIGLMQLQPHHCRWPMKDKTYCGEQKVVRSYCMEHHNRAYRDAGR